jgi:hypothetical protein
VLKRKAMAFAKIPGCPVYVFRLDHGVAFVADQKLSHGAGTTAMGAYKRHGTTTLFAALNVLDGTVIGHCVKRHRDQAIVCRSRSWRPLVDDAQEPDELHLVIRNNLFCKSATQIA